MKTLAKSPIMIALVGLGLWFSFLGALWIIRISTRIDWRGIHEPEVELRLAELAARPARRPVLWGEATEGNAFDSYNRIRATLEEITTRQAPLIRSLYRRLRFDDPEEVDPDLADLHERLAGWLKTIEKDLGPSKDDKDGTRLRDLLDARLDPSLLPSGVSFTDVEADFRQLLRSLQPVLDLVRRGAHCKQARRDAALDPAFPMIVDGPSHPPFTLETIETLTIQQFIDDGDSDRAMDILLDGLQYGRDCLDDPSWAIAVRRSGHIRNLVERHVLHSQDAEDEEDPDKRRFTDLIPKLSKEQSQRLEKALVVLSRPIPPYYFTVVHEYTSIYQRLTNAEWVQEIQFQPELPPMLAKLRENIDAFPRTNPPSWLELQKAVTSEQRNLPELAEDTLYMYLWPNFENKETTRHYGLSDIAIMRAAILDHGKQDLRVKDPFGTFIHVEHRKDKTLYWSVGPDGIDQKADPEHDDLVYYR